MPRFRVLKCDQHIQTLLTTRAKDVNHITAGKQPVREGMLALAASRNSLLLYCFKNQTVLAIWLSPCESSRITDLVIQDIRDDVGVELN